MLRLDIRKSPSVRGFRWEAESRGSYRTRQRCWGNRRQRVTSVSEAGRRTKSAVQAGENGGLMPGKPLPNQPGLLQGGLALLFTYSQLRRRVGASSTEGNGIYPYGRSVFARTEHEAELYPHR